MAGQQQYVSAHQPPAFTDATAGGTWSITNGTGTASISAARVVTGLTAGTATVNYAVTSGGCTTTATRSITINGAPAVAAIGGGRNDSMCRTQQHRPLLMQQQVGPGQY